MRKKSEAGAPSEPLSRDQRARVMERLNGALAVEEINVRDGADARLFRELEAEVGTMSEPRSFEFPEGAKNKRWASGFYLRTDGLSPAETQAIRSAFGERAIPADCGSLDVFSPGADELGRLRSTLSHGLFIVSDSKPAIEERAARALAAPARGWKVGTVLCAGGAALCLGAIALGVAGAAVASAPLAGAALAAAAASGELTTAGLAGSLAVTAGLISKGFALGSALEPLRPAKPNRARAMRELASALDAAGGPDIEAPAPMSGPELRQKLAIARGKSGLESGAALGQAWGKPTA